MKLMRILVSLGLLVLLWAAWDKGGWAGLALVGTAMVTWVLLNVHRMMTVMQRAAQRPQGYVLSAVMLHAKLKPKVNLMHVTALTQSLGVLQTEQGAQPEVYRWADDGGSYVDATFANGRLTHWELFRPEVREEAPAEH